MKKTCHWCGKRDAVAICEEGKPVCATCIEPVASIQPADRGPRQPNADRGVTRQRIAAAIAAGASTLADICDGMGLAHDDRAARRSAASLLNIMRHAGMVRAEAVDPERPYFKRWSLTGVPVENKKPWSRRSAA